jgi:schlafen family protein
MLNTSSARAGTICRWISWAAIGAKNGITNTPGPNTKPASVARYWVGVCWDGDFYHNGRKWVYQAFKGTKWQYVDDEFKRLYLKNADRVTLTRSRQGMIVFVPKGDTPDRTRPPPSTTAPSTTFARVVFLPSTNDRSDGSKQTRMRQNEPTQRTLHLLERLQPPLILTSSQTKPRSVPPSRFRSAYQNAK